MQKEVSPVSLVLNAVTHPLILFLYQNNAPAASRISSNSNSTGVTMEAVPTHTNTHKHKNGESSIISNPRNFYY